ncbi:MAG: ABC transporter permease [Gammaproteobacteria bacterium]|nr:ABC transporter permease [Gammaproteobacteria bacterium]
MISGLPVRVGLRYSRARKGHFFLSFISAISFFGLLLGVVALTVVVSVMNGFDRELKRRILGAVPHVVIEVRDEARAGVETWLAEQPEVVGRADFLERPGVVIHGSSNHLVSIYGIEPSRERGVSILPDHLVTGTLDELASGGNRIIMGRPLAYQSGIRPGDSLTVIVPEPSASGKSIRPRLLRVEVAGLFELDSELDYSLALMHGDDLARLRRCTAQYPAASR